MSGIQLRLQREVFTPHNEQLLNLVHCIKLSSEKDKGKSKDIYLCLVNEADRSSHGNQFNINIVEVKESDKRGDLPKRKRSWTIQELRSIDGKHQEESVSSASNAATTEDLFPGDFELGLNDKLVSYKAINYEEKKRFLTSLIGLSDRVHIKGNHSRKISLNNLPPDLVLEETLRSKGRASGDDDTETIKESWLMMGKDEADEAYQG